MLYQKWMLFLSSPFPSFLPAFFSPSFFPVTVFSLASISNWLKKTKHFKANICHLSATTSKIVMFQFFLKKRTELMKGDRFMTWKQASLEPVTELLPGSRDWPFTLVCASAAVMCDISKLINVLTHIIPQLLGEKYPAPSQIFTGVLAPKAENWVACLFTAAGIQTSSAVCWKHC